MTNDGIGRRILAAATEAITDEQIEAAKGTGLVCFRRKMTTMYEALLTHCGRYTTGRCEGDAWIPGTWDIVSSAFMEGLITDEEYLDIFHRDEEEKRPTITKRVDSEHHL